MNWACKPYCSDYASSLQRKKEKKKKEGKERREGGKE